MSFIADVSIAMPLMAPTHEAVPEAEGTLADYHRISDESGSSQYVLFLWISGCEFEAFERAVEADDTVDSFEAIADSRSRRLYRVLSEPMTDDRFELSVFVRDHSIALHDVRRDRDGLHLRAQFPSRESLQALQRAVDSDGGWFRLDGIYSQDSHGSRARDLTDRQREVLGVAANLGYFESPSETTLAEVAEELAISPQAVSTHLRSAVRKLVAGELERYHREGPSN